MNCKCHAAPLAEDPQAGPSLQEQEGEETVEQPPSWSTGEAGRPRS